MERENNMREKIMVEALDTYEKNNIRDSELNRIPKKGEIFPVSKNRFEILRGNNVFKKTFVKLAEFTPDKEAKEVPIYKKKGKK